MTTKPDPVVEALESVDKLLLEAGYLLDSSSRHQLRIAMSLARSQTEKIDEQAKELARLRFRIKHNEWPPAGLPESEWEQHHLNYPSAASEQAEKAALYDSTRAALEWLLQRYPITFYGMRSRSDCPAIIKQMIEKKQKA